MKLKIVSAICAFLNLGDQGKLDSFFNRQIKRLKSDKDALEHNKASLEFNHKRTIAKLNDDLVDAEEAKENAYMNVDVEILSTNAEQDAYADIYWGRIERAAAKVVSIKERIKDTEESYTKKVEDIDSQIEEFEYRIAKLSEEETTTA